MMIYLLMIIILTLFGVQSMKDGRQANTIDSQSVVPIQYQWFYLCSGTIIDDYHILTVAHMVVPHLPFSLSVVPGLSVVRWPYCTKLGVENIYPHPHYKELQVFSRGESVLYWDNDIAILRLKQPVSLSSSIGIVSRSTKNFEYHYHCFECTMISWNYSSKNNLELLILMWDVITFLDNNKCEQRDIRVLANQQCFIDLFETALISTEDLGSPIMCGDSMVGLIVKEARKGDATSPAVFLSTFKYAQFISDIIHDEMNAQPEEFPYMVSIWSNNEHVCGGVIVNVFQVVTAAQCIGRDTSVYFPEIFKITVGSPTVTLFAHYIQWYLVSHLEVHPHYQPNYAVNDSSWQAEHDIGLITVSSPFSWSPTVQKLTFADEDDFFRKQFCHVLHWRLRRTVYGQEYKKLTKTKAVLLEDGQQLVQLGTFQIAAKEMYPSESVQLSDMGNPIVCGGHPLGIMVRIRRINEESHNLPIIFLRIRPYALMGFFQMH